MTNTLASPLWEGFSFCFTESWTQWELNSLEFKSWNREGFASRVGMAVPIPPLPVQLSLLWKVLPSTQYCESQYGTHTLWEPPEWTSCVRSYCSPCKVGKWSLRVRQPAIQSCLSHQALNLVLWLDGASPSRLIASWKIASLFPVRVTGC